MTFKDLSQIQAPVLALAGEHDLVLDAHTWATATHLPHATLLIFKGTSHNAPVEIPAEFNRQVLSFLAEK